MAQGKACTWSNYVPPSDHLLACPNRGKGRGASRANPVYRSDNASAAHACRLPYAGMMMITPPPHTHAPHTTPPSRRVCETVDDDDDSTTMTYLRHRGLCDRGNERRACSICLGVELLGFFFPQKMVRDKGSEKPQLSFRMVSEGLGNVECSEDRSLVQPRHTSTTLSS
jgi:hypothetical protein